MPNGTVHSGCTDPTQATARLVIVLASRIQKSGTGDNNFVKWKGTFRSDRPKWPDRSLWTTFKAGPEYSGRTKPKWCTNRNFRNFGLSGKRTLIGRNGGHNSNATDVYLRSVAFIIFFTPGILKRALEIKLMVLFKSFSKRLFYHSFQASSTLTWDYSTTMRFLCRKRKITDHLIIAWSDNSEVDLFCCAIDLNIWLTESWC